MQAPSRANPGTVVQRFASSYQSPEVTFSQLRAVVSQPKTSVVAIVDVGDMLTADPERYSADERHLLMLLKKSTLEASVIAGVDTLRSKDTEILESKT